MIFNKTLKQIISYGIIGLSCSLIDIAIFSALVYALQMNEYLANFISVVTGLTISFFFNRKYTFGITNHVAMRYASFFIVGTLGLLLSELVLYLLEPLDISPIIPKLASILLVGTFQFVCNKFVSFKTRHGGENY